MLKLQRRQPRQSYNHSNIQKGWKNASPRPGKVKPWLTDEVLKEVNRIATPIREYILDRYVQEAIDPLNPMNKSKIERVGRFVFLGREAVPIAIDISQWGYEVHVFVSTIKEFSEAEHDARMQAGLFASLQTTNYFNGDFITSNAVVVVGMPEFIRSCSEAIRYVKNVSKRAGIVLCLLSKDEWYEYLGEGSELRNHGFKYDILAKPNEYICLSIESA